MLRQRLRQKRLISADVTFVALFPIAPSLWGRGTDLYRLATNRETNLATINAHPVLTNESILLRGNETASVGQNPAVSIRIDEAAQTQGISFAPGGSGFVLTISGVKPGESLAALSAGTWQGANIVLKASADRKYDFDGVGLYVVDITIAAT